VYTILSAVIRHVWHLWELLLVGEPLMVVGPRPRECSEAVAALISLLAPLPYLADFRPYLVMHDPAFVGMQKYLMLVQQEQQRQQALEKERKAQKKGKGASGAAAGGPVASEQSPQDFPAAGAEAQDNGVVILEEELEMLELEECPTATATTAAAEAAAAAAAAASAAAAAVAAAVAEPDPAVEAGAAAAEEEAGEAGTGAAAASGVLWVSADAVSGGDGVVPAGAGAVESGSEAGGSAGEASGGATTAPPAAAAAEQPVGQMWEHGLPPLIGITNLYFLRALLGWKHVLSVGVKEAPPERSVKDHAGKR
jgi:hypothetical protein